MDPSTFRRLTTPKALALLPSGKLARVVRMRETEGDKMRVELRYIEPDTVVIDPTLLRVPLAEDIRRIEEADAVELARQSSQQSRDLDGIADQPPPEQPSATAPRRGRKAAKQ